MRRIPETVVCALLRPTGALTTRGAPGEDIRLLKDFLLFRSVGKASLQSLDMDMLGRKLQQKALQQPKQKKSKSAEFLMDGEDGATLVGIENPSFDGGGSSTEPCAHPAHLQREMRGNEHSQNDFDPLSAQQTDPRQCMATGVNAEDELELTMLNADEKRLYHRMAALLDDENTFVDIPGTVLSSRDEEVLEVKAGDPVLQRRLLLHAGTDASGIRPSQVHSTAKTAAEAADGFGDKTGLQAGRMVMGKESSVKARTAENVIPDYAQQLRERVRPDMITLGSLSLQQNGPQKGSEWEKRTRRLVDFFTRKNQGPQSQSDNDNAVGPALRLNPLFQGTTDRPSVRVLGEGQEETTVRYGGATERPVSASSSERSSLWQDCPAPQPVEVGVRCLRATRDKVPRGLYSMRVGLHSRLGGPILSGPWAEQRQGTYVSTEPVHHRGQHFDVDLHINQSLTMVLPVSDQLVPSMVLIFELVALPGHGSHVSSVLGWGAFPVCGPSFRPVQGSFKTPLLRGEPSRHLDQFKKIESLISSDLDHWLCNLYFQVKALPAEACMPECCITVPSSSTPALPQIQSRPHEPSQQTTHLQPGYAQSHMCSPHHLHVGPSRRAEETTVVSSHQGSPLLLSADSACSSSSSPGKNLSSEAISGNMAEKSDLCVEKAESASHHKKKPIKKTNSTSPSTSGSSAAPRQAHKHKMLSMDEMEEYTFSLQLSPGRTPPVSSRLSDRTRLALRMLPSELGWPSPWQQARSWRGSVRQPGLIMLLLALMWFVRLYLHYCSQWLYLQAIAVPVNKFSFHAHTVELVYQGSLLHTREELAMVVVGPLTLNAVTLLLVLIRWACQQIFGSLPSFTSKLIMAQGVWTVLDPLAVFAVDAILGHLVYSPETPVGDAAKLFWHFYRVDQSGVAGVVLTVFLYTVLTILSLTIMFIYLLRFHNDGRMLDVYQRLVATDETYFLPQDLEVSNQELSYIVKKAEQWRGYNGARRKVAVYDHIWTEEDPLVVTTAPSDKPPTESVGVPQGETSTHLTVHTLFLSGLRQMYRQFLRLPDGAIIEVIGDTEKLDNGLRIEPPGQILAKHTPDKEAPQQLRKRKKLFGRHRGVEPVGRGSGSSFVLQDLR